MPTKRIFGPAAPSRLALMGIRFFEGEGGAAPAAPAAPATPPATPAPAAPAQDTTDWKEEARKWEGRAKENKTAAEELAAIKDSQKTDQQRLEERAMAAEKLAADNAADAIRARVALEKGLTPAQEKRLIGSTREELLADADALLADLGVPVQKTPVPDPSLGPKNEPTAGSVQAGRDLFDSTRKKTTS